MSRCARVYVYLGLLLVFLADLCHAQLAQQEFESAVVEMNEGRYVPALQRLQMVEQAGYISGPLFLNLAIGYTALDSLGKAKFYYLKAQRYPETAEAAAKGLTFVEGRLRYRSPKLPDLPWDVFFNFLRDRVGVLSLLISTVVLLNLAGIWLAVLWFRPTSKKWARWGIPILALTAAFSGLAAWRIDYAGKRYAEAIQVISETKVMDKPAPDALPVSASHEGYSFIVDYKLSAESPDWFYVRMSNGAYGWIERRALKVF